MTASRLTRVCRLAILAGWTTLSACAPAPPSPSVIVLGFDGMDHALTRTLMEAGRLPRMQELASMGGFAPLETSVPPQSPVAWSSFITGLDAGGHGIFDFMHRDPGAMLPYQSTTRTEPPARHLSLGGWQLPLSGGHVELLRHGTPFWDLLARRGIETTIVKMPANFPPSGSAGRELSGMGTPDLVGSYGTFSFFSSNPADVVASTVAGGRLYEVRVAEGAVTGTLDGPDNPFRTSPEPVEVEFHLSIDPVEPTALLEVGDQARLLRVGEWSDWVPLDFELAPTQSIRGMARFHVQSVRPAVRLYVSPVNLDPSDPALPISSPSGYAPELAADLGPYYTQGMPEDTQALAAGVLTPREFLEQARIAGDENVAQFRYVLDRFHGGLLFHYFGNLDQVSHMMWRSMDPDHPAYDPERDAPFADVIPRLYEQFDAIVGHTLDHMPPGTLLIVMSDHGFASWRRSFHLNAWLAERGYLVRFEDRSTSDIGLFTNVDWTATRAYGVGLNGLYLNLQGREAEGIVDPRDREGLLQEIGRALLGVVDPATGSAAVTRVYRPEASYRGREFLTLGPDLIVGYAKGTRCSNESALGGASGPVLADNTDPWSGDHCMDHAAVPGVLLSNRPLVRPVTALQQLGGAILAEFGIDEFPEAE